MEDGVRTTQEQLSTHPWMDGVRTTQEQLSTHPWMDGVRTTQEQLSTNPLGETLNAPKPIKKCSNGLDRSAGTALLVFAVLA